MRWVTENWRFASSAVSRTIVLAATITHGSSTCAVEASAVTFDRCTSSASDSWNGAKWVAMTNGRPSAAATVAPPVDEPSTYSGVRAPCPGNAKTRASGHSGPK